MADIMVCWNLSADRPSSIIVKLSFGRPDHLKVPTNHNVCHRSYCRFSPPHHGCHALHSSSSSSNKFGGRVNIRLGSRSMNSLSCSWTNGAHGSHGEAGRNGNTSDGRHYGLLEP